MEVALVAAENKKSSALVIPETVTYKNKNYTVAIVETSALKECDEYLRDLSFPSTVRKIRTSLFLSTSSGSSLGNVLLGAYTMGLTGGKGLSSKKESKLMNVELQSLRISKNTKIIAPNAFCTSSGSDANGMLRANITELPSYIITPLPLS